MQLMNDEACDGCDGSGIRPDSTQHGGPVPDGFVAVERCDTCQRFDDDLAAAKAWGTDASEFQNMAIAKPPCTWLSGSTAAK